VAGSLIPRLEVGLDQAVALPRDSYMQQYYRCVTLLCYTDVILQLNTCYWSCGIGHQVLVGGLNIKVATTRCMLYVFCYMCKHNCFPAAVVALQGSVLLSKSWPAPIRRQHLISADTYVYTAAVFALQ
jgi:hypothetical protein